MDIETNTLDNFSGWNDLETQEDFFSSLDETSSVIEPENNEDSEGAEDNEKNEDSEKTKEAKTSKKDDDVVETKSEKEADLFNNIEDTKENEEGEDEENEEKSSNTSLNTFNYLKEKGYIEVDEDEEISEEDIEDILEEKFSKTIENKISELFEEVPDVVKQINKIAIDGGDVNSLIKQLGTVLNSEINSNLDIENEANQEKIVRKVLLEDGNDQEFIDSQIDFLKDSNKLETYAKKQYEKLKKQEEKEKEVILKKQEEELEKEKEKFIAYKKEFESYLKEADSNVFTKEDKKELPKYVLDRKIKLQNGSYITELQKDLFYDLPKNKEAYLQLAALMKNRNEDGTFNFSNIAKDVEDKVTKKVKNNIRRSKETQPNKSKGYEKNKTKSLADFFN